MTISIVTIVLIIACVVGFAVLAFRRGKRLAETELFTKFELDAAEYRLISTDLGGEDPKVFLSAEDIVGVADAMFRSRRHPVLVVGEAKSRRYRGRMRRREYYQMILYLGAARRQFPRLRATGRLSYADAVVPVEFDEATFRQLLSMVPELRQFLAEHPKLARRRSGRRAYSS